MPRKIDFFDSDDVRKILRENGFSGTFVRTSVDGHLDYDAGPGGVHTSKSLRKRLNELCENYGVGLPKGEFMSLFYVLGNLDSDAAFLYTPRFKGHYNNVSSPSLKQIVNVSRGLTRILPMRLIAVCEKDRFKIPKLMSYRDGKIISRSKRFAGEEKYHPDFHDMDERKIADNFDRNIPDYVEVLEGVKEA